MGRAERRRIERQIGKHRAKGKKGRRDEVRKLPPPDDPRDVARRVEEMGLMLPPDGAF